MCACSGPRWTAECALQLTWRWRWNNQIVYHWCMARTNIDIDEELCRRVMERYHLSTKREAVNMALLHLAGEPLDLDDARSMRGTGWDGDLDEMRSSRA